MVSLVLTIIAFAGAMGVPAFLTAIVESAVRPSSLRPPHANLSSRACRHRDAEHSGDGRHGSVASNVNQRLNLLSVQGNRHTADHADVR